MFSSLVTARLVELFTEMERRSFSAGDILIREGEPGTEAYMLLSGRAAVYRAAADGQAVLQAHLEPGTLFGEMALLALAGGRRNATVEALSAGQMLVVSRGAFREALDHDAALQQRLLARSGEQQAMSAIVRSPLAALLRAAGGAAAQLTRRFAAGEVLLREGSPGDGLYVLLSGTAGVYMTVDGIEVRLALLLPGACAGERAILGDAPRAATLRAETDVAALFIDRRAVLDACGDNEDARRYFATLHRFYQLQDGGLMSQRVALVDGAACLETTYDLPGGRCVICVSSSDRELHTLREVDAAFADLPAARICRWDGGPGRSVHLELDAQGAPLRASVRGEFADFRLLYDCFFRHLPIPAEVADGLERSGRLELGRRLLSRLEDETVCVCLGVPASRIHQVLRTYAVTADDVEQMLGCGSVCGSCRFTIEDMIAEDQRCRSSAHPPKRAL